MVTALSLYSTNTASSTISTCAKSVAITGGTTATISCSAPNDATQNYSAILPVTSGGMIDSSSAPVPIDKGILWDATTLESNTIVAGNWSGSIFVATTSTSITFTVTLRFYKRSSGGSYTSIGTITTSSYTPGNSPTTCTFSSTSLAAVSFSTGDKLYYDAVFKPTSGTWGGGLVQYSTSNSSTQGFATNGFNIVTPGYIPSSVTATKTVTNSRLLLKTQVTKTFASRLLLRVTNTKTLGIRFLEKTKKTVNVVARFLERTTATKTVTSARVRLRNLTAKTLSARFITASLSKVSAGLRARLAINTPLTLWATNVAGPTLGGGMIATQPGGQPVFSTTTAPADKSQNYLHINSLGGNSTTSTTMPATTFQGWLLDSSLLEGMTISTGPWRINAIIGGTNAITCNMICKISKQNLPPIGGVTLIGTQTLYNVTIPSYTYAGYNFTIESFQAIKFNSGDKLYIDFFIQPTGGYKWIGNSIWFFTSETINRGADYGLQIETPGYTNNNTAAIRSIAQRFKLVPVVTKNVAARFIERTKKYVPLQTRILLRNKVTNSAVFRLLANITKTSSFGIRFLFTNIIMKRVKLAVRFIQKNPTTASVAMRFLNQAITQQTQVYRFIMKLYNKPVVSRIRLIATNTVSLPIRNLIRQIHSNSVAARFLEQVTTTPFLLIRFLQSVAAQTSLSTRLLYVTNNINTIGIRLYQRNIKTHLKKVRFLLQVLNSSTAAMRIRQSVNNNYVAAIRLLQRVTNTVATPIRLLQSVINEQPLTIRLLERVSNTTSLAARFIERVKNNSSLSVRLLQSNIHVLTMGTRFIQFADVSKTLGIRFIEQLKRSKNIAIRLLEATGKPLSMATRLLMYNYTQTLSFLLELRIDPDKLVPFRLAERVKKSISMGLGRLRLSMGKTKTLQWRLKERTKNSYSAAIRLLERNKTTAKLVTRFLESTLKTKSLGLRLLERTKKSISINWRLLEAVKNSKSLAIFRLREATAVTKNLKWRFLERTKKSISVTWRLLETTKINKVISVRLRQRNLTTKNAKWRFLEKTKINNLIGARLLERVTNTKITQFRFRYDRAGLKYLAWRFKERVTKTVAQKFRLELRQYAIDFKTRLRLKTGKNKVAQFLSKIRPGQLAGHRTRFHLENIIGSRLTSGGFGCFSNGVFQAQFDNFRATTYPDKSLSLAPINPVLGSTWFNYSASIPVNTTVKMELSYDGITWYDMTTPNGAAFPVLYQQPTPTIDGFATTSLTNYTQAYGVGGSVCTYVEDITNSQLFMNNGNISILFNNAIMRADIDVIGDFSNCDAGGFVWRYIDQNNFYFSSYLDNKSIYGTPGIFIWKVVSGVYYLVDYVPATYTLGQSANKYTIGFNRGAYYRFRINMIGSLISIYMDGILLAKVTDTSLTAAGYCGLMNYAGSATCHQLWITPIGDNVGGVSSGDILTGKFVYTRQTLTTSDPTVSPIIYDITTLATTPDIQLGATIPSATYDHSFLNSNFDDATKQSNFMWYFRPNQTFVFNALTTTPAPWILQSTTNGLPSDIDVATSVGSSGGGSSGGTTTAGNGGDLELDVQNDQYRNRQIILGAQNAVQQPAYQFFGDGKATTFTLGYPIAQAPLIAVNDAPQSVGTKGSSGFQWYYAVGDPVIVQDASQPILQTTDIGITVFVGLEDVVVTVDNVPEQVKRASIEGGSGIVEAVEDHTGEGMLLAQAENLATQLINRYANQGRTLLFDTSRDGLAVGMTLPIYFPEYGITDGNFIIVDMETVLRKDTNDQNVWWYKVTCSELPKISSWSKLLAIGLGLT